MNTENSKPNEPHKFLIFSQRLDLRSSNKDVALQNLSIRKNIRKQYENNSSNVE